MESVVRLPFENLQGRRVFLTGHTGFKGSWLTLWLEQLGARVTGYALAAPDKSMYSRLDLDGSCNSVIGDVRDREHLRAAVDAARPDVVVHMAAQALVLASYNDPVGTIETNVVGTANLLDAVRTIGRPATVIVVTSDKCYENRGWIYRYRETDRLGGHDIYSMSKAAAELLTESYRRSFFAAGTEILVASVRAGNVIGGGDYAANRILPDCVASLSRGETIQVRNPSHVRPWQHVLEPLGGYLLLASKMLHGETNLCEAWNFAPMNEDARTVEALVRAFTDCWGGGSWSSDLQAQPHEAHTLRVSPEKAHTLLDWSPRWSFETAVKKTAEWYRAEYDGATAKEMRAVTLSQIAEYQGAIG